MNDSTWVLDGGRLIDPANGIDRIARLVLHEGKVHSIDTPDGDLPPDAGRLDVSGKIVAPGLVDLATELREPGSEEDETIQTGSNAALAGGYTTVLCCSSTKPLMDSAASVQLVRQIAQRVDGVRVLPIACLSKGRQAEQMAELGILAAAGAAGFSDTPRPMPNDALLKRALDYCRMFDLPIFDRPEVPELADGGVMHDGQIGLILGLKGLPTEAEDLAVARDVRLAEATKGRLHVGPVSTMGSIDMIGRVKSRGIRISASVCPHNLFGSDELLRSYDSRYKVHPPMRSPSHVEALRNAVAEGVIDAIESGHMPRAQEKKANDLDLAPFGASALETTLAAIATDLVETKILDWSRAIECLSTAPARIAGVEGGTLSVGANADVTVIDPSNAWSVEAKEFRSRCHSSPMTGRTLSARVTHTLVGGRLKFELHPTAASAAS
ncbi:dihydroorotase [Rhodopirellula europaea]|uniref:Dihydroorotase, multifunctional complex type n=1 Tax=Rhodopirellula europaea SH398 TaxID=1263868 RepID=M5SJZ1_9BACT|nr:dihydroorotase [Rhodopirellula europaea]EMI28057.1 dihydroorotase, multifunctional complex type [Rhodopirellula europaea SH398]